MNKLDLRHHLTEGKFKETSFSLDGGESSEALCLDYDKGKWWVYYSERGLKTGPKAFESEDAACAHFLDAMRSDPATRIGYSSGFSLPPMTRPNGSKPPSIFDKA